MINMKARTQAHETEVVLSPSQREETLDQIRAVIKRVDREKPDPEAVEELREMMRVMPSLARLLYNIADINSKRVIDSIVSGARGREALIAQVATMRDDLGYAEAPELERGLIEHVVMSWLRVQRVELSYTHAQQAEMTLPMADWWERKLTAAHGRYIRACESLARVRRLTRPSAVQINVGDRQVNVAGVAMTEQQPRGTQKEETRR